MKYPPLLPTYQYLRTSSSTVIYREGQRKTLDNHYCNGSDSELRLKEAFSQMPKPTINLSEDGPTPLAVSIASTTHLLPLTSLFHGLNVRPGETPAEHEQRVADLARGMKADGQKVPIVVRPRPTGDYEVVDGQGRLDALQRLDASYALCTIDNGEDPWATAVKLNVQRRNYNDIQLATLIQEARQRYGWDKKGAGGGKKCADFFGITEPLLVEYNTLAGAPQDVKDRLSSGELSKSAALRLVAYKNSTPERRQQVVEKAKEIAAKPKVVDNTAKADAKQRPEPKVVKVQAQHIVEASRQVAAAANEQAPVVKRNRTEILAAINQMVEFMPKVKNDRMAKGMLFLSAYLRFADGLLSPKQLQNRWNDVIGFVPKAAPKKK